MFKNLKYLLIVLFLSIGFLPLENMALCIAKDGHAEIEIVDEYTKKCSDFNLTTKKNDTNPPINTTLSVDHCTSCVDLLLGSSEYTINTLQIDFNIIQSVIHEIDFQYSVNNVSKQHYLISNPKEVFNSSTVLSLKSVKILC